MTIAKKVEEFKEKFVKESVFGVAIGAIDNFSGTGEEQVLKWLETSLREVEEEAKKDGYSKGWLDGTECGAVGCKGGAEYCQNHADLY